MLSPSLEMIQAMSPQDLLRQGFRRVPVKYELYADFITPIEALRVLKLHSQAVFLLESIEDTKQWGRYSFLGYKPKASVRAKHWEVCIAIYDRDDENARELLAISGLESIRNSAKNPIKNPALDSTQDIALDSSDDTKASSVESVCFRADPKAVLAEIVRLHKSPKLDDMPPFCGGLVGYFAYDYIRYAESSLDFPPPNKTSHTSDDNASSETKNSAKTSDWEVDSSDDMYCMLFESVIVFDHFTQKLSLITNLHLDRLESSYKQAESTLAAIADMLRQTSRTQSAQAFLPFTLEGGFTRYFHRERFCEILAKAKAYITQGDIFQVVLSNPIQARANGDLFDVYRVLRTSNPSPYMFYLSNGEIQITGASPETLVRLNGDRLYTYPLAGSRKRGESPKRDLELERELLSDEKELSEHNMLVDLARNDMGRVAEIGSVEVAAYKHIVRYSHIMHIASTITATLADDENALSALEAILPAGTLSGAPKIRACEIIHELEDIAHSGNRGIYGGAIGYVDFSGGLDTCIAIRLVYKKGDRVFVRSGAGIVYDSDELAEWQELENKAKAIIQALEIASKGLR